MTNPVPASANSSPAPPHLIVAFIPMADSVGLQGGVGFRRSAQVGGNTSRREAAGHNAYHPISPIRWYDLPTRRRARRRGGSTARRRDDRNQRCGAVYERQSAD